MRWHNFASLWAERRIIMDSFDKFISDEMLAAYIDGNAIPLEGNIIDDYLNNGELQELLEIVTDIKANSELIEIGEDFKGETSDVLENENPDSPLQELKKNNNNII